MILTLLLTLHACDSVKNKVNKVSENTKEVVSEAKQKISDKKDQLVDKVFPSYDSDKPDTRNNKKRFKDHLQVDPTSDVKDIYSYGDFLGIDYKVLIAFSCDQITIDKIVATKKMKRSTQDDNGLLFLDEFKWWNKDSIKMPEPYKVGKDAEYWEYLWYDPKSKQAFYEEYSL